MNIVPDSTWDAIQPYFAERYPEEAVAVVWQDGSWDPIPNIHDNPQGSFRVSDEWRLDLVERSDEVLVLLHTHPNGSPHPSDRDSQSQINYGFAWGISVVQGNPASEEVYGVLPPECWGDTVPMSPLEGREMLWVVRDCFTLMRDYHRSVGVLYPNPPRIEDPTIEGAPHWAADQIRHWMRKLGFVQVSREDRKPGDSFTQCWGTRGSWEHDHCGIYMGEGKYLHQWNAPRRSQIYLPPSEKAWIEQKATEFWRFKGVS